MKEKTFFKQDLGAIFVILVGLLLSSCDFSIASASKEHLETPMPLQSQQTMASIQHIAPVQLRQLASAIFSDSSWNTHHVTSLITDAINERTLPRGLYKLRAQKIKTMIGNNIDELCHKNEINILHTLSKQRLPQLQDKDNRKQRAACEQIFELVHQYVLYRVRGIEDHINYNGSMFYRKDANSPMSIYCSPNWGEMYLTSTFEEHKAGRLNEIDAYYKKPKVNNLLQTLQRQAPALLVQQQSLEKFLLESKNPFSDPGVRFMEPPFLAEFNELVTCVASVYTKKHTDETFKSIDQISQKFNAKKDSRHVLDLLRNIYIPIEHLAFWPHHSHIQPFAVEQARHSLGLYLSTGLSLSHIIRYDLLEISDNKIKEAKNTLKKPDHNTLQQTIEAGRILLYSRIPWHLMRNISALFSKPTNVKNAEESLERNLIFEANNELRPSWESLLPALEDLIAFEVSVATQQVNINPDQYHPITPSQYAPLEHLGNYSGDVLFLRKISDTLGDLDFSQPFITETYLRLLGILGECAKNLSPKTKKIIGENYWNQLAKIRDKTAHTTGYLRRIQEILVQKTTLTEEVKTELQELLLQVKTVQGQFPTTWSDIQQFYNQPLTTIHPSSSTLGTALHHLQEALDPILTEEDYQDLRSTKQHIPTELGGKRDQILKVLNQEIKATDINQGDFFALVDGLYPMAKKQQDKIKEVYKNLRQGKEVKSLDAIQQELKKIESVTEQKKKKDIESLIKNLKNHKDEMSLGKELAINGLSTAKDIWEAKRQKFFIKEKRPKIQKQKSTQASNVDQVLTDSIDAAKNILRILEALNKLVHVNGSSDLLSFEQFWANPILCYAVEFHFTRLRAYVDIIQEALDYLPRYDIVNSTILALNNLYQSLSGKLKEARLYGNSLAHLHDITELDGRTAHGHRLSAYQELWGALKDYKSLTSIQTITKDYISVLTKILETINRDRATQLEENRKNYHLKLQWQEALLKKLPDVTLTDYQILSTLSTIDKNDPTRELKQRLYKATKELYDLQQEFLKLEHIAPIVSSKKRPSDVNKYTQIKNQKLFFEEIAVVGNGWCTLHAAGIADPTGTIDVLKNHLNTPRIIRYIRNAIENNYQASLELDEEFGIVGVDHNNNSIKDQLDAFYSNCKKNDSAAYLTMLAYLERSEVQTAYLNYLLTTRYADSNIVAACLALENKKLALFIDYHLPDGRLVNISEDHVLPNDPNTVCLILHPNDSHSAAHYNRLKIIPNPQQP